MSAAPSGSSNDPKEVAMPDERVTAVTRPEQVQRPTFYLLVCERCGHVADAPKRVDTPDFVKPVAEPMRCNDCDDLLLLAECFVAPLTTLWQRGPGWEWKHVIYPEALPDKDGGRHLWMQP
jgi:hypothetical protein